MRAPSKTLSVRDRWLIYLVIAGMPGLLVSVLFGFAWSMAFEVVAWVPQQRLFDALRLKETLPYQDL